MYARFIGNLVEHIIQVIDYGQIPAHFATVYDRVGDQKVLILRIRCKVEYPEGETQYRKTVPWDKIGLEKFVYFPRLFPVQQLAAPAGRHFIRAFTLITAGFMPSIIIQDSKTGLTGFLNRVITVLQSAKLTFQRKETGMVFTKRSANRAISYLRLSRTLMG